MPWLPIYADRTDFNSILEHLNLHEEIAFIVRSGSRFWRRRWRAVRSVERLTGPRICLWHIPSGPLPLLRGWRNTQRGTVLDPWRGWTGSHSLADRSSPYFGAGHPGIFWLNYQPESHWVSGGIGLSSFEWIGNRYASIRAPAAETTKRCWEDVRRWVRKQAVQIPRDGPVNGPGAEIWALPSALTAIRAGQPRDPNP
jgi:hypothetical protein